MFLFMYLMNNTPYATHREMKDYFLSRGIHTLHGLSLNDAFKLAKGAESTHVSANLDIAAVLGRESARIESDRLLRRNSEKEKTTPHK